MPIISLNKIINLSTKYNKLPPVIRKGIVVLIILFVLFILLNIIFPFRLNTYYSTIIYSQDSTLIHGFLSKDDKWRMYTTLEEITPQLKKAIIFKEDKYFYFHFGVNPVSVARAFFNNIKSGKRTSGASTITMQVVRLLQPKERTYFNKLIEIFNSLQLEWHYSKNEIFQMYLNLVPYGGNIEGIKSASVIYFGKLPSHLSIGEIATLSIIPNRPVSLRLGKNNDYIQQERNKWLLKYKKSRLFKDGAIQDAIDEPLNTYRREVPRNAPHLSIRLKNIYPGKNIIYSCLDMRMQKTIEALVKNYSNRLYFQNIRNATALVLDNKTREVKAYIGSADFYNNEDGGQVDGIRSVRSPGSTLKPLLFGIAMDKGLLTPKTIISDVPLSLSGYEPENYDGKYYGNISVEFALANSLNVPSVKVLQQIETRTLVGCLIQADFRQIKRDKDHLGLSVILGGCGATLEELTNLYSAFANNGAYQKAKYLINKNPSSEREILTEESTYIITDILTQLARPDLPIAWANSVHMPKIAWKTGTSYGRRDAWSIGYNKKYTVGVWVGNFSGEGVPELNGASTASPLLFEIFNAIDYNSEEAWYHMPEKLSMRAVCPESGLIPNHYCKSDVIDYFIPGVSSMKICDHLKEVYIDPDSSISYCVSCRPELGYIKALYPNLSPEIITYFDNNNVKYLKIPPHNPKCERIFMGHPPEITSPIGGNEYYLDVDDEMQVMLSCNVANDAQKVFWYINKKFYKSVKPGKNIFFKPEEGKIEISCSDDKGRNTDITITVKYISF